MKYSFSAFFLVFFLICPPLLAKEFMAEYKVKTKGIVIGKLLWQLDLNSENYKISIHLDNSNIFLGLYKFKGRYSAQGKIINKVFLPDHYSQSWKTKRKKREVDIVFADKKISKLNLYPKEKELPRFNYYKLVNYKDPLTSFLDILINKNPTKTIDGRRAYILSPDLDNFNTRVSIKKYNNIWADHNKNDLEYINIFKNNKSSILPNKINIKFKGNLFTLTKI